MTRTEQITASNTMPQLFLSVTQVPVPVLVNDNGWSQDGVTTEKFLPQIHRGVMVTVLEVAFGHLGVRGR